MRQERNQVLAAIKEGRSVEDVLDRSARSTHVAVATTWSRSWSRFGVPLATRMSESKAGDEAPTGWVANAARWAAERARSFSATTKEKVLSTIRNAGDDALGRVRSLYDKWARWRPQALVENEVRASAGLAEEAAAAMATRRVRKRWNSQRDDLVRHTHQDYEGTWLDMDQEWAPGLAFPHDPRAPIRETAGCRCSLSYAFA